jgi:hypothetical protein
LPSAKTGATPGTTDRASRQEKKSLIQALSAENRFCLAHFTAEKRDALLDLVGSGNMPE